MGFLPERKNRQWPVKARKDAQYPWPSGNAHQHISGVPLHTYRMVNKLLVSCYHKTPLRKVAKRRKGLFWLRFQRDRVHHGGKERKEREEKKQDVKARLYNLRALPQWSVPSSKAPFPKGFITPQMAQLTGDQVSQYLSLWEGHFPFKPPQLESKVSWCRNCGRQHGRSSKYERDPVWQQLCF